MMWILLYLLASVVTFFASGVCMAVHSRIDLLWAIPVCLAWPLLLLIYLTERAR